MSDINSINFSEQFDNILDMTDTDIGYQNDINFINISESTGVYIEYIIVIIICLIVCFLIYLAYNYFIKINNNNQNNIHNLETKNVFQILESIAVSNPDLSALVIRKNDAMISINYEDYFNNIKQFAESLNYWVGSKINVTLIGSNCPAFFYSYMGTIANGGAIISINKNISSDVLIDIINNSDTEAIVVEDESQLEKISENLEKLDKLKKVKLILYYSPVSENLLNKFKDDNDVYRIPVVSFGAFIEHDNDSTNNSKKIKKIIKGIKDEDVSIISYNYDQNNDDIVKGSIITYGNIKHVVLSFISTIKNKSSIKIGTKISDRFVSYLPLDNVMTQITDIFLPIIMHGTVWFAENKKTSLITTLNIAKPTIFIGTLDVWNKLMIYLEKNSDNNIVSNLMPKYMKKKLLNLIGLYDSEYCLITHYDSKIIQYFNSIGLDVYNIYGINEGTGIITVSLPNYKRTNSVGIPIDNLRIKINMNGEILIKGETVFKGYYKNKKETIKAFNKGWYKTGVKGKLDTGYLFLNN